MRWTTILIGLLALGGCLVAPAAAATPLVADSAYCGGNGGAFTVACIQAAVTEAMFSPTFDMVQLETGVWTGCLANGVDLSGASNLVITTTSWPNLPAAESAEVTISCGIQDVRHFYSALNTNVTISGFHLTGGINTGDAGAIYAISSTLTLDRLHVTALASLAQYGGGVFVGGGSMTIVGCVFDGIQSPNGFGGAFHVQLTNVFVIDTIVRNSFAYVAGGFFVGFGAVLDLSNVTIEACSTVQFGGAIGLQDEAFVVGNKVTVDGCSSASLGGGLYGQVDASIDLTDSVVRGCTSETGAGIAVQQNCNVTLTRCEFSDNSANLNGGAVFSQTGGVVNITDTHFRGNSAVLSGGSVYVLSDVDLVMTGGTISECYAGRLGAGVGSSFASITMSNMEIFNNTGGYSSGGVYFFENYPSTISNCTFHDNEAVWGGSAYFSNGEIHLRDGTTFYDSTANVGGCIGVIGLVNLTADGTVELYNCHSRTSGGAMSAALQAGVTRISGFVIRDSDAVLGGGGLYVQHDIPDDVGGVPAVIVTDMTITNCTAGTVGGGIASASLAFQADAHYSHVTVAGCSAHRGGGFMSSAGNTTLRDSTFTDNSAFSGGCAAIQSSPCGIGNGVIENVSFTGCEGFSVGGGLYTFAMSMDVTNTTFESSVAPRGSSYGSECFFETCVFAPARVSCDGAVSRIASSSFSGGVAVDGSIWADNQRVEIDMPPLANGNPTVFVNNTAERGGAVFATITSTVAVNGMTGPDAVPMLAGNVAGSNVSAYGQFIASGPDVGVWGGSLPAAAMAGTNLCEDQGSGCVVELYDGFANVVPQPVVVEIVVVGESGVQIEGPQYVLVAEGRSAPIKNLGLVPTGAAAALPGNGVNAQVGLRRIGAESVSSRANVTATHCSQGYGSVANDDGSVSCVACAQAFYSATSSWDACEACAAGTSTGPDGGASSCEWCDVGYGWDEGSGGCVPCAVGSFSEVPTLNAPCAVCGDGLTTSGDGAVACTAAINTSGGTPFWVWLLLILLVIALVACVAIVAWRRSRAAVVANYYIDEDATVKIDDKVLSIKIQRALKDGFASRIGGGEYTDIYRVRDGRDIYVLKLLKLNLEGSGAARSEFDSEAQILASLQARVHPGIIRARFYTASSPVCIGLDYCSGGTLKDFLATNEVSGKLKIRFATQVASSMAFLHSKHIAHLDLKTTNILLAGGERPYDTVIADFGISVVNDAAVSGPIAPVYNAGLAHPDDQSSVGKSLEMASLRSSPSGDLMPGSGVGSLASVGTNVALTPQYTAPERLLRSDLTFAELLASDVYTYGVVVWVIYTQREPFLGMTGDQVLQQIRANPNARFDLPTWMDDIVRTTVNDCWQADASRRPAMAAIRDDLGRRYTSGLIQGQAEEAYLERAQFPSAPPGEMFHI